MDMKDMHVLFRTLGQQKGLQQVRAILPNEIDAYLNAAIIEKCRSIIQSNTTPMFQDKISQQQTNVSPINALTTLIKTIELDNGSFHPEYNEISYSTRELARLDKFHPMMITSIYTRYSYESDEHVFDPGKTRMYKCRLLENDKFHSTLYDFCSSPSKDAPIAMIRDLYGDMIFIICTNDNEIPILCINYIKNPCVVRYREYNLGDLRPDESQVGWDDNDCSHPCDLPEHLHSEIVEIAVNKFFQSVGSTTKPVN